MIHPIRYSQGVVEGTTRTIVKIYTDEGITGFGETTGASSKHIIENSLKHHFIGANPFDIEKLLIKSSGYSRHHPFLTRNMRHFSGIEIALWDIIGKHVGIPVHYLIGGKYRTKIPFTGYMYPTNTQFDMQDNISEDIANNCKKAVQKFGYTRLEIKLGVFKPETDIKIIQTMREVLGSEIEIGIDSNGIWAPETAIRTIRKMESYDLCNVEEPCIGLLASARVRQKIHTPISTHIPLIPEVIKLEAADVLVLDPYEVGGINVTKKMIACAEQHNLGCWLHSTADLGISMAANMHIIASSPHIIHPSQGTYEHISDDIIKGGKFQIIDGKINVPTGSGLGISLDDNKVEKYNQIYEENGEYGYPGYGLIPFDPNNPDWWPSIPTW